MKAIVRGCLLAAALGTALALSPAQPAHAQSYPAKPIKLILPFAAGGAGDTFARPLAQALSQSLGQPVVIENIAAPPPSSAPRSQRGRRPTAIRC